MSLTLNSGSTTTNNSLFGGRSSMNSKDQPDQSTVTKDNSAVVESTGQSVSDGALAGRDDAQIAGGNAAKDQAQIAGGNLTSGNDAVIGDVGNSATVSIESVDSEVVSAAGELLSNVSEDAFGFGVATVEETTRGVRDTALAGFDAVEEAAYQALQANRDVTDGAFALVDETTY